MKKDELQNELKARNLRTDGQKKVLLERLLNAEVVKDEADEEDSVLEDSVFRVPTNKVALESCVSPKHTDPQYVMSGTQAYWLG